jgi:hypothetical protein
LDEIHLTSSFNFLLQVLHLTLIYKKEELHQRNYIPMIVKIYRERGKNKKSRGRRGLTLTRIILRHSKNFIGVHPKKERNGKNGVRSSTTTILP